MPYAESCRDLERAGAQVPNIDMAINCDLQVTVAAEEVPHNVAPFALAVIATGAFTDVILGH